MSNLMVSQKVKKEIFPILMASYKVKNRDFGYREISM
jgi:hypothetical protein